MTDEITDGHLDRLDEVIEEFDSPEPLEDDAPEVMEAADDDQDEGFEDAGEEEHQAKRESDGLTRNQRRAKTRYDKIYREKREAQERAQALEAKLQENERQFQELSREVERYISGTGLGTQQTQSADGNVDVASIAREAAKEMLRKEREEADLRARQMAFDSRKQKIGNEWEPIYKKVERTHPAVAGWFVNEFASDVVNNPDRLDILEAAQELDYPLESLYAAAADESFKRLTLGGKIKLIAKANKKIAARKSQPSKADNPIEAPGNGGTRRGGLPSNEELFKNWT